MAFPLAVYERAAYLMRGSYKDLSNFDCDNILYFKIDEMASHPFNRGWRIPFDQVDTFVEYAAHCISEQTYKCHGVMMPRVSYAGELYLVCPECGNIVHGKNHYGLQERCRT